MAYKNHRGANKLALMHVIEKSPGVIMGLRSQWIALKEKEIEYWVRHCKPGERERPGDAAPWLWRDVVCPYCYAEKVRWCFDSNPITGSLDGTRNPIPHRIRVLQARLNYYRYEDATHVLDTSHMQDRVRNLRKAVQELTGESV